MIHDGLKSEMKFHFNFKWKLGSWLANTRGNGETKKIIKKNVEYSSSFTFDNYYLFLLCSGTRMIFVSVCFYIFFVFVSAAVATSSIHGGEKCLFSNRTRYKYYPINSCQFFWTAILHNIRASYFFFIITLI